MMNKLVCIISGLLCAVQIGCATNPLDGPLVTLKATVSDEAGEPIQGAILTGGFRGAKGTVVKSETNEEGYGSVAAHSPLSVNLLINKEGFYESKFWKIDTSEPSSFGELTPRTRTRDVTLRQIMNPVPLIAKHVENIQIPVKGEWVGYDLEIGDWVEPHGKGKRRDVLFRYSNEFLGYRMDEPKLSETIKVAKRLTENRGEEWTEEKQKHSYGNWSGRLEIGFPGEKEGIIAVSDSNGYLAESELRMPHLAPEDGYEESIIWSGVRNGQFMPNNGNGFFLRIRVRERNDQILEANYAKINLPPYGAVHDGLRFDPRGKISFTYYFNPDVNHRNLEFDPEKNLLEIPDSDVPVRLP
ncbi:MAG: carboxypeptidase-like regulatory domain-containing protein [Coraliomargaritaceae bacterium]